MKIPILPLALILILGIFPASGRADETADEAAATADKISEATAPQEGGDTPPVFTLSPQEGDRPQTLSLKAALRLMKSYQVTTKALQTCAAAPGAGEALKNFNRRNGNTLAPPVMEIIKNNGGLTPEIKAVMDAEAAAETEALLKETNCRALTDLVAKSARDLYKAPELAEDYKRVREEYRRISGK